MNETEKGQDLVFGLASLVALVWAFELILIRVTSGPVPWRDLALSTAAWVLVLLALIALLRVGQGRGVSAIALRVLAGAPVAVVAAGILLPLATGGSWPVPALTLLALIAAALAWAPRRPVPTITASLPVLFGAATATWLMEPDPLPDLSLAVLLGFGWLGLTLIAGRDASKKGWMVASVVVALIIARLPDRPRPVWSDRAPAVDRPDVVLLTIDTLRADAARSMDSYQRLASRGLQLSSAQAPAPWTLPSMATIMTGEPPAGHGAWAVGEHRFTSIDEAATTLAESFQSAGYDTAAVIGGNGFVGSRFGFSRGFDFYEHPWETSTHPLPRGIRAPGWARPVLARAVDVVSQRTGHKVLARPSRRRPAPQVVDRALQVLDQRRERPIFLWLHFMDTHLPYLSSPGTSRQLAQAIRQRRKTGALEPSWYGPAAAGPIWQAYRAEVEVTDAAIERLLDRLDREPTDAVIALTSDHGEEILDHGLLEHGHSLYQELLSVPLVIQGPFADPGRSIDEPVGLLDIAPTLLGAAGLTWSATGVDLAVELEERVFVSGGLINGGADLLWASRRDRYKLIVHESGVTELYDLEADGRETVDLSADRPDLVELLSDPPAQLPGAAPPSQIVQPTAAEERRLRALGYLGR